MKSAKVSNWSLCWIHALREERIRTQPIIATGGPTLQGDFFYWSLLNFLSTKSLYNLWQVEKFWASLHGIRDFVNKCTKRHATDTL